MVLDDSESRKLDVKFAHNSPIAYRFRIESVNKIVRVTKVWRCV
jgi:hypothetical protein